MEASYSAAGTAPLTTMASAMFFGSITFCAVAMACKSLLQGDFRAVKAAQNPRSSELDVRSFISIYTLLHHGTILGLIMLYAYICEYHPPFPHATKSYDRDEFFFMTALLIVVSLFTLKNNDPAADKDSDLRSTPEKTLPNGDTHKQVAPVNDATEVLNRDQTEEWKGWMQFMFLLYHYYHAEEVYNAIRIMITCYVWMTGFGNFSFFYLKGDYSSIRVMQMLWRLNFLVIFLCLTQGTTYILYYICLLHTYFFLMVYVTMRVAKHVNYTKWGIRVKLAILACIIYLIWDVDSGIFKLIHMPFLGTTPMLGAPSGSMWEWYFRSSLDHWSTFFGMLFALNFPITSLFFRKLEAQPLLQHILGKTLMVIAFLGASYLWVTGPFQKGKFDYNQTNSYYGIIPLIAYIFFRNLTPWLRSHSLELLHQIGKTTLETYLMQHHIWLTSDAKSLLTLIPGWPMMNFLVVSIIYVFLSRRLYQLTLFLRGMILPNDRDRCLRNLLGLGGSIFFYLMLAFVLRVLGLLNLFSVAICSVGCGLALFRVVVQRTWPSFDDSGEFDASVRNSLVVRSFSPTIAAIVVLALGIAWHHMARTGATKIRPLPATCDAFVQKGAWIPVDGCNEGSRGLSYRDYGVGSLGTCSPQSQLYTWGWEAPPPSTHCRLAQRDTKTLLKTLKHRNVTFVGDSIVRHLYHATCRQAGDTSAGAYNTSLGKWSDFSRRYGKADLEFRWAPYYDMVTDTLKKIGNDASHPDLVVVGGGAWDRLHRYNTTELQGKLHSGIKDLTKEMVRLRESGVPVAWVVPTTINTWGLLTEEKRNNIREDQMAELRTVYKDAGIYESSSFVLDGQSFTRDRVTESYDGVHYPLTVYDAGAQILANAVDWLLPEKDTSDPFKAPQPGAMANPFLGLMMLAFVFVSVFFFDGFVGLSYLAAIFAPCMAPSKLYEEAFSSLHRLKGLPDVENSKFPGLINALNNSSEDNHSSFRSYKSKSSDHPGDDDGMDHEELQSFLDSLDEGNENQSETESTSKVPVV